MPPKFRKSNRGAKSDDRQALIRAEMRFLLQGNDARFAKQLQARLLAEGCNLPLSLAKPLFCRHVARVLIAALDAAGQDAFMGRFPDQGEPWIHARFHPIIRFLHSRLPDAEIQMTRAAMDALAAVLKAWRLESDAFTQHPGGFEALVSKRATRLTTANPAGRLGKWPLEAILRRLRMALTASLLRHIRDPARLREEFGPIAEILKGIQQDPDLFCRVMASLSDQLPYFDHLVSRVFWRTLNNLDTEQVRSSEAGAHGIGRA